MPLTPLRLTAIVLVASSLAACVTPRYAVNGAGGLGGDNGSRRPPPSDPSLRGTMKPYEIKGVWYTPRRQPHYNEVGVASWYGEQFHNRSTANGEVFDMDIASAAHKTLPLPSIVEVTNLDNHRKLRVRVNDRGPFVDGRIIDLSKAAAEELGFARQGVTRVRVRYVGPAGDDTTPRRQTTATPLPVRRSTPLPLRTTPVVTPQWRVQAAAFNNQDAAVGAAQRFNNGVVEPFDYQGRTLWRVMLGPVTDAKSAEALRGLAAEAGYEDARVLNPF